MQIYWKVVVINAQWPHKYISFLFPNIYFQLKCGWYSTILDWICLCARNAGYRAQCVLLWERLLVLTNWWILCSRHSELYNGECDALRGLNTGIGGKVRRTDLCSRLKMAHLREIINEIPKHFPTVNSLLILSSARVYSSQIWTCKCTVWSTERECWLTVRRHEISWRFM